MIVSAVTRLSDRPISDQLEFYKFDLFIHPSITIFILVDFLNRTLVREIFYLHFNFKLTQATQKNCISFDMLCVQVRTVESELFFVSANKGIMKRMLKYLIQV